MRWMTLLLATATLALATSVPRAEEAWPSRPIRMIVPFGAGQFPHPPPHRDQVLGGTGDRPQRRVASSLAPAIHQVLVLLRRVSIDVLA